jgi:Na+/H+-dicarboxylate symporter
VFYQFILEFNSFVSDYIKPFGTIFLNMLKLVAMPLIFVSLVAGVAGLSDITKLSVLGLKPYRCILSQPLLRLL